MYKNDVGLMDFYLAKDQSFFDFHGVNREDVQDVRDQYQNILSYFSSREFLHVVKIKLHHEFKTPEELFLYVDRFIDSDAREEKFTAYSARNEKSNETSFTIH